MLHSARHPLRRGGEKMSNSDRKNTRASSRKEQAVEQQPGLLDGTDDSSDLLEFESTARNHAAIKVVGVGGGGGNALNNMIASGLQGVEFIAANTDAQALEFNSAPTKVQLGSEITRGLGCGADPEKGRGSALEVRERLREVFQDTDMVFVTAGLGGGTGTGAAPVVAEIAREMGALTVGVVTKPFAFEGKVRTRNAERGLDELHAVVDTVITIPNQRLLALAGKNTAMKDAFGLADEVLFNAVRGISDLITIHGLINLDFADVRTIMNEMGVALMGTGTASGDERAVEAARAAISSPLLEDLSIEGAHGVLINITGGPDLTLFEVNEASTLIQEAAHEDVNIIFGAVIDDSMPAGEMRVTVIATGLDDQRVRRDSYDNRRVATSHNVTPLRPEPQAAPAPAPAAEEIAQPIRAESPEPSLLALEGGDSPDFVSPFDDEYDVPAFLRARNRAEKEDDPEAPTFLRRSAD
jgi:cell division protein FtsZ